MAAIFRQIKSGGDRNFAYLIAEAETKEAVLIDPSPDVRAVSESIKRYDLSLIHI